MSARQSDFEPMFLSRLTRLPLVGGSVTLVGNPTSVDVTPTPVMLEAYSAWLHFELRFLNASYLPPDKNGRVSQAVPMKNDGANFHNSPFHISEAGTSEEKLQSIGIKVQRRAALVLSAVGCGWGGQQAFDHLPLA